MTLVDWNQQTLCRALVWARSVSVGAGVVNSDVLHTDKRLAEQGKTAGEADNIFLGREEESPWRHLFEAAFAADFKTEVDKWRVLPI